MGAKPFDDVFMQAEMQAEVDLSDEASNDAGALAASKPHAEDFVDQIFDKPEQGVARAFVDESLEKIGVDAHDDVEALDLGRDRRTGALVVRRHAGERWTPITDYLLDQSMREASARKVPVDNVVFTHNELPLGPDEPSGAASAPTAPAVAPGVPTAVPIVLVVPTAVPVLAPAIEIAPAWPTAETGSLAPVVTLGLIALGAWAFDRSQQPKPPELPPEIDEDGQPLEDSDDSTKKWLIGGVVAAAGVAGVVLWRRAMAQARARERAAHAALAAAQVSAPLPAAALPPQGNPLVLLLRSSEEARENLAFQALLYCWEFTNAVPDGILSPVTRTMIRMINHTAKNDPSQDPQSASDRFDSELLNRTMRVLMGLTGLLPGRLLPFALPRDVIDAINAILGRITTGIAALPVKIA